MNTYFYPTKQIAWPEFRMWHPPGWTNESSPDELYWRCNRVIYYVGGQVRAIGFAWQNARSRFGWNEFGTHFELRGSHRRADRGGVILATIARTFGCRMVSDNGELVSDDGTIATGVWDDEMRAAADRARRL